MRIAVTDANIFIDLYEIGRLEWFALLALEVHTTSIVLTELNSEQAAAVREVVMVVRDLTVDEVADLATFDFPRGLSEPDKSMLWYAQQLPGHSLMILSGDSLMRKTCVRYKIEVHGMLWLFDRLVADGHLSSTEAHDLLLELMRSNQWLPLKECDERLRLWKP